MQYINDTYRYLGDWRASERGYVPFSLAEIERNGYGDCKDLAILLAAMLKAAGIKAEPTLVSRGDVVWDLLVPGMYAPNHAIVRAEVDGKTWWLDPTNPVFAPGRIMPDIQQRWALVLGADGKVRRDEIPLEAPGDTLRVTRSEHYTHDGEARVESRVELSNAPLMQPASPIASAAAPAPTRTCAATSPRKAATACWSATTASSCCRPAIRSVPGLPTAAPSTGSAESISTTARTWPASGMPSPSTVAKASWPSLYLGEPQITSYDISLSGGKTDEPAHSCEIRSPWFDIDLQAEPAKDGGYHYRYREVQKTSWLNHDEINSAEFGKLIEQSRGCVEQLRLVVKLDKRP